MTSINKKMLALIHVAKKQLGMTEDEYRALLSGVGVTSSKDLTLDQFKKVMTKMEQAGFKPRGKDDKPKPLSSKDRQVAKIGALLADMGLNWSYADSIARRMYKVDLVVWCNPRQLRAIIAALTKKHQKMNAKC